MKRALTVVICANTVVIGANNKNNNSFFS